MWQTVVAWLTWLAADPQAVSTEAAKASGAVSVAYAATAPDVAPTPAPVPPAPKPACCQDCGGRGYIVHGDGHRTPCPCPPSCQCKRAPGAALTPGGRAAPAGEAAR